MVNATKYLSLAALVLMGTLASCQSDDEAAVSIARPADAVSVNFSVGSLQNVTRSNPINAETQNKFNLNDQVSVATADQEAVVYKCTSTEDQTWTATDAGKFLRWTASSLTFKAYYPVTVGTSMTAFTLPADQSTEANIALADYMTKEQDVTRVSDGTDVTIALERKMARVIVNIAGFGSQYFDDQKTVSNVRIYSEASGIEDGNPTGSSTEIQPYAQGDGGQGSTYTALVVPGSGDGGARFIQLSDGEGSTLLVKGIPELEAGNSYTFNLTVGKEKIEVASVTVQNWTDATLEGGQATEGSAKAPAVTPNIAQADCTFSPSNGKSTLSNANITTSMEYSADNGTTWTDVTSNGSIASLAAGTVQIRVKETVDNLASEAVSITVPEVLHINELVGPYTGDRLTCEYYAGETWQALVDRYDLIKVYSGRAAFGSDGFIYDENGSAVSVTALVDNTKTYEVQ